MNAMQPASPPAPGHDPAPDPATWERPPTLVGRLVCVRPLEAGDGPAMVQAIDSPDIFEFGGDAYPEFITRLAPGARVTEAEGDEMVQNYLGRGRTLGHWPLLISTAGGAGLGLTVMYDQSREARALTIGYTWISRAAWGTHANTEAKLLLLTHAFEVMGCRRVQFNVDNINQRSQAAMLKLGATREGELRLHRQRRDGSWRNTVVFSVVDDEWPGVKAELERRVATAL
ncbi:GNAT family N-acetyltransferase [Micrococcales bacterium 31B]|nr:GNAT family N-acetyltransferase [Micrococcales bacterium 31B]